MSICGSTYTGITGWWYGLSSEAQAGWVGAMGTIVAAVVAVVIYALSERRRFREVRDRRLILSRHQSLLILNPLIKIFDKTEWLIENAKIAANRLLVEASYMDRLRIPEIEEIAIALSEPTAFSEQASSELLMLIGACRSITARVDDFITPLETGDPHIDSTKLCINKELICPSFENEVAFAFNLANESVYRVYRLATGSEWPNRKPNKILG